MIRNISLSQLQASIAFIPNDISERRHESWNDTIEMYSKYNDINPGRISYLYKNNNIRDELEIHLKRIKDIEEIKSIQIVEDTSNLGLPMYLKMIYLGDENELEIKYDGLIIYFSYLVKEKIHDINTLLSITESNLGFRNESHSICNKIGIPSDYLPNPFYEIIYNNIDELGFKTDSDYPTFELICNDESFFTLTNLGDKQIGERGKEYSVYFGIDQKSIRDKICTERVLYEDHKQLLNKIEAINIELIQINEDIINSLFGMPESFLGSFRKRRQWKKLKNIPNKVLTYEKRVPEYQLYLQKLEKWSTYNLSHVNVQKTIWVSGEDINSKEMNQRTVPNFFCIKIEKGELKPSDNHPRKASYYHLIPSFKTEIEKVTLSLDRSMLNHTLS